MNKYNVKMGYDIVHHYDQVIYAKNEEDAKEIAMILAGKSLTAKCVNVRVSSLVKENDHGK